MKYKVGDKVRIKESVEPNLEQYKGKIATITCICKSNTSFPYEIDLDNGKFFWGNDDFEPNAIKIRGFEVVSNYHRKKLEEIQLPTRGSKTSAGYDFYSPIGIEIQPHQKVCIWTDVKAYMQEGEVLMLYVRSSIGIKRGLRLSNSTGIIDSDYYSNEGNDGNIGIALHNYTDEVVKIEKGERICQGVFIPFLVADNGNTDTERVGGIGSSGTK